MKVDLNSDVFEGIIYYCKHRNYKCSGCRFSVKNYSDSTYWTATCIFENCPCDWHRYYKSQEGKVMGGRGSSYSDNSSSTGGVSNLNWTKGRKFAGNEMESATRTYADGGYDYYYRVKGIDDYAIRWDQYSGPRQNRNVYVVEDSNFNVIAAYDRKYDAVNDVLRRRRR